MYLRRLGGVAAITAMLTMVAAPALASTPDKKKAPSPFSAKAVAKVVATTVPAVAPSTPAAPATPAPKQSGSQSFFKSRAGLLVLGAFVVGTGYAIYSAREDRIKGINR